MFHVTSVFAFAQATWLSYVLAELHPDNSGSTCPNPRARSIRDFLLLIGMRSESIGSSRIETWQKREIMSDSPPDPSPLSDS